jgi:hypothetical protein
VTRQGSRVLPWVAAALAVALAVAYVLRRAVAEPAEAAEVPREGTTTEPVASSSPVGENLEATPAGEELAAEPESETAPNGEHQPPE